MSLLDGPLVFVDIETNGLNHIRGRVIEVAAIRVENGQIVDSVNTLVDPGSELPQFITNLTGITSNQVRSAPTFAQVAEELYELLDGSVFVAHNVRFDYSFLKQEFRRLGKDFLPRQLCTVKLSRVLYPDQRGHKLQDLINRHSFTYESRHRAYDDAHILWQFLQHVRRQFPEDVVEQAVAKQIGKPALPTGVRPEVIDSLPTGHGVYIFEDEQGRPLYVGKSITVKKRVLSHFGHDHDSTKEFKLSQSVRHITVHQTSGELESLLLESRLVKELQPLHNRMLRKTEKLLLAKADRTDGGHISVRLEETSGIDGDAVADILAVYPRRSTAKSSLQTIAKTFDLCPKLMGLEKTQAACFWYQLHKCRGACVGDEPPASYNERLYTAFDHHRIDAWPFRGPVLIEEVQESADIPTALVIDKWCVLAEVSQEEGCEPVIKSYAQAFDLDAYKILRSFILNKTAAVRIRPLSPGQLSQLGL
jgi:DNA polymerase-3 subunit epsilon